MEEELSDSSPGWEAIDSQVALIYEDQEPRHYGTVIPAMLGGPDPIDGISVFRSDRPVPHWHFVTYGFTELHSKEWEDPQVSGFGFELTFRLPINDEDEPPTWALNFLQNLGRYVFETGNRFEAGHYLNLNGPIAVEESTAIKAIVFIEDPELGAIDTPHGSVTFLQIVGITLDELETIKRWNAEDFLSLLGRSIPEFLTELDRPSVLEMCDVAEKAEAGISRDGSSTSVLFVGAADWSMHRRLFGPTTLKLTFGANGVQDLKAVLPGRLPFDRNFVVTTGDRMVVFEPGDVITWRETSDEGCKSLTITLPPHAAVDLARVLQPKEGTYQLESQNDLLVEVEKSYIKDSDGNVQEVIG